VAAAERLLVIDRFHPDPDPDHRASWRLHADPDRLARSLPAGIEPASDGWSTAWRDAVERARRAIDIVLDATDEPAELRLARDLADAVPDGGTLFVGNSTPIRDLDVAMAPREGLQVLANRGASGIDGLVSTALGAATGGIGPTFALIGDLSLLHDAGAVLWNGRRQPPDLVLVVPNNRGGAIVGSLGQRDLPERDRLFVTPHDVDLAALCAAAGVGHHRLERMSELAGLLRDARAARGIQVVEVPVPAERSRGQRIDVQAAVDVALADR
jgi:2-succinyl-5-enolpyruvyl-6-hydroxy-3-cyclohexene-1-carboxylate synthase